MVWACLAGRRNEGLDCEVYALHAARSLKLHLWRDDRWAAEEEVITQPGLFNDVPAAVVPQAAVPESAEVQASEQAEAQATAPAAAEEEPVMPRSAPAPVRVSKPTPAALPRRGGWSAKSW
jgi:phage terminase large subunit GpA-like protein